MRGGDGFVAGARLERGFIVFFLARSSMCGSRDGGASQRRQRALIENDKRQYARAVEIEIFHQMPLTRPCRFCLCLQAGSVFADFDVDPDGAVFAVRVSFDGHGCCTTPTTIGRMNATDSALLVAMVEQDAIGPEAATILRGYFRNNRDAIWSDALAEHGLV